MNRKHSLKSNFIYNIGYQILTILLPLITAPYVSRTLGAYNVGVYSYTQAFANYFYLFAMLGVNNYGNRKIAQVRDDRDLLKKTFWEIASFQLFVAVVVSIAYVIYCSFANLDNRIVYLMQFFYVVSGALDVNWFCFGMENFKLTTLRSTIVRIAMATAVFIFVRQPEDLWRYTFILSFGMLASAIAVWPYVIKEVGFVKPTMTGIVQHIKPNLVLFWPVIAVSLYNIMDKLMLGFFSTKEEVAYYTYAYRIVEIPLTLILALDNVIMPRMANLYAGDERDRAAELMNQVMLFAMLMSAGMAFGLAGIGETFAPWFYGSNYVRCGLFVALLSPTLVFKGWASAIRTQFIIPSGRDRIYVISLTAGALVNMFLNLLLIPVLSGIGAIIGTIAAEFTVCFIQFFMSRREINIKKYVKNGIGFCVIGLIMYFPVVKLSGIFASQLFSMAVQIMTGILIYGFISVVYMVGVLKEPFLVNYVLKLLHIKLQFREDNKRNG